MTALAKHAMPSFRPMAPRPSARLPFTLTGAPAAADNNATILSRAGAIRGLSQITLQSTLPIRQPAAITFLATSCKIASESAPFHCREGNV